MALTIYRRHRTTCSFHRKARHAPRSFRCARQCAIWVQGFIAGEYVRRSLKLTDWEVAVRLVQAWEMRDRLGAAVPDVAREATRSESAGSAPATVASAREDIPTVEQAVHAFVTSLQQQQLSRETVRKSDALLTRRLVPWCEQHGHRALADLHVTRLDDFRAAWTDGPRYAKKNLERLRAFFQFCQDQGWISSNPARAIKLPQVRRSPASPFSAEEMERILAACDEYRGNRHRLRAFVLALRYSGVQISDAIALHPDQVSDGRLRLYTTKTGEAVYVPLPPLVIATLKKIERPGQRYFSTGHAQPSVSRGNWSRYLASLFRLANVENGHSLRFRDTFATSLLEQGVPVETVAILLAKTPAVVRTHYAPWIKSRQIALEAAVRTTWPSPVATT